MINLSLDKAGIGMGYLNTFFQESPWTLGGGGGDGGPYAGAPGAHSNWRELLLRH